MSAPQPCTGSGKRTACSHTGLSFKLSADPEFVAKVRDIGGLYLNPPEKVLVFSVDEKSQIQALDRTQPVLPMRPGLPERQTRDYERQLSRLNLCPCAPFPVCSTSSAPDSSGAPRAPHTPQQHELYLACETQ